MTDDGRPASPGRGGRSAALPGDGALERVISFKRLARSREAAYRLLSQALFYPDRERLGHLRTAAEGLWTERATLARFASFLKLRLALELLRVEVPDEAAADREGTYLSLFSARSSEIPCSPYESSYLTPPGQAAGWVLAAVEREYAAAGLKLPPGVGELPDHIAVELEFMAMLCGGEGEAWDYGDLDAARGALEVERRFLATHLCLWVPGMARKARALASPGHYEVVVDAVEAVTGHDLALVEAFGARMQATPGPPQG